MKKRYIQELILLSCAACPKCGLEQGGVRYCEITMEYLDARIIAYGFPDDCPLQEIE